MMAHWCLEKFRKCTKNSGKKCTKNRVKNYAKPINRVEIQRNRIDGFEKKVYDMNYRNNTKLFRTEDEGNEKKSSCGAAGRSDDIRTCSGFSDRMWK